MRALFGVVLGGVVLAFGAGCSLKDDEPDLVAGKTLFMEKCSACHVLSRADAQGTQGPNLDHAFQRALRDGMGRDGIESAVKEQILYPARLSSKNPVYMPPKLVEGEDADNVAAYVADSVARPGKDTGLLAEAGKPAGGGEPAVAENGVLEIEATAQLAYVTTEATAKPGPLEIKSPNPSGTPHNIALEGPGVSGEEGPVVQNGGSSDIEVTVRKGEYTFYCSVPGHREGGMEGKLTVE
jgi:plastocyanin